MARHNVDKLVENNKSFTELILSHGYATTNEEENKGTMVSNTEVNLVEDLYERSVDETNTIDNVSDILEVEVKDSIKTELLMSTSAPMMLKGVLDVPIADDSSDLGSLDLNGANGLCDGDLATADLQPGHSSIIRIDRGMMMNTHELELVRSRCTVGAEHGGDRAPRSGSQANHGWAESLQGPCHPQRTSRTGKFIGRNFKSGYIF